MKKLALLGLTIFFLSFGVVWGQEEVNLIINIDDVVVRDNKITGSFKVKNNTSVSFNNLAYTVFLHDLPWSEKVKLDDKEEERIFPGMKLVGKASEETFHLLPSEERRFDFELAHPHLLVSGIYPVIVEIFDAPYEFLAVGAEGVNLKGNGNFLDVNFDSCRVKVKSHEFFLQEGPNLFPGEKTVLNCEVKNSSSLPITTVPLFLTNKISVFGYPPQDYQRLSLEPISFKPNESKNLSFELPSFLTPQVYETALQFTDEKGAPFSPYIFFRWIVKGESARFGLILPDKDIYQKGESAKISVGFYASMDLYWENLSGELDDSQRKQEEARRKGSVIEKADLFLTIKNEDGKVCGKTQKTYFSLNKPESYTDSLEIPIKRSCFNPRIGAKLESQGKILTQTERTFLSSSFKAVPEKQPLTSSVKTVLIFFGIITILGFVWFLMKARKKTFLFFIIAFIVFGLLYILGNNTVTARNGGSSSTSIGQSYSRSGILLSQEICQGGKCLTITQTTASRDYWGRHNIWVFNFGGQRLEWGCVNIGGNGAINDAVNIVRGGQFVSRIPPPPPPSPTVSLSASPTQITQGQSSTLSWTSSNVDNCVIDQGIGNVGASGSRQVSPNTATTYTITCNGVSSSATVNVVPLPALSFSASPSQIIVGESSTLSWSSQNVTSCSASGQWSGAKPVSGSQSVTLSSIGAYTYTLTCTGPGGSATRSATINVKTAPQFQEI